MTRATGSDELHDVLRRVGELDERRGRASASSRGSTPPPCCASWCGERRAIRLRLAGARALHRRRRGGPVPGRARGGAPGRPAGGVRGAAWRTRCRSWWRATRAPTGPSRRHELHERYGVDAGPVLRELERAGTLVRGELRPGGSEREWCDVEVLRRLRRASLAALRKEIEPAEERRLAAFLPAWQGDRPPRAGGRRRRPPARGARAAAGAGPAGRELGARRDPAPHRRLLALLAGRAVRQRRAGVGGRRAARAAPAAWRCTSARTPRRSGRPAGRAARRSRRPGVEHELIRGLPAAGPVLLLRSARRLRRARRGAARGAVGPRVGRAR